MVVFTGCIVADPPEYQEPKRTPPILDLNNAEPSPYWVVVVDREDNLQPDNLVIKVPLRSDDQGERVWFGLHVDYKSDDHPVAFQNPVPPSTIDDTSRSIGTTWAIDPSFPSSGCHQLTLLVAHESSWEYSKQLPKIDAPKDDIAIATWWLNLDPAGSDPFTLPRCPSQSEVQQ
jgi:hypothetical protein